MCPPSCLRLEEMWALLIILGALLGHGDGGSLGSWKYTFTKSVSSRLRGMSTNRACSLLFTPFLFYLILPPDIASYSNGATVQLMSSGCGQERRKKDFPLISKPKGGTETSKICSHPPVPASAGVSKEYDNHLYFECNQAQLFSHRRLDRHFYLIKLIIISQTTDVVFHIIQSIKKQGHSNANSIQ